ncbi:hypothetical protein GH714_039420 [Hevea brasiliensis]|uniref:adenine phosphoribosyltransferase n=1 Tax=Hevea brasiliensis TaxID=3981 RepID=A0A6A6KH53_HEVBR|nr:hypothetical protein GH714_039420 [Hevea brasiliensis]
MNASFTRIEARGFMFGPSIALAIGAKFVPLRKSGKLPERMGAEVVECACVIGLPEAKGQCRLKGKPLYILVEPRDIDCYQERDDAQAIGQ